MTLRPSILPYICPFSVNLRHLSVCSAGPVRLSSVVAEVGYPVDVILLDLREVDAVRTSVGDGSAQVAECGGVHTWEAGRTVISMDLLVSIEFD